MKTTERLTRAEKLAEEGGIGYNSKVLESILDGGIEGLPQGKLMTLGQRTINKIGADLVVMENGKEFTKFDGSHEMAEKILVSYAVQEARKAVKTHIHYGY